MAHCDPPKEHRFTSENQPKNRGRKKSILTQYKNKGVSTEDVQSAFSFALGLSYEELKEIVKNPGKQPMIIVAAANAILKDMQKGELKNVSIVMRKARNNPELEDLQKTEAESDKSVEIQFHTYEFPAPDPLE